MIILDSDVMIDLLREYPPALAWLDTLEDQEIGLPGFVVMELLQGCRSKAEQTKVEQVLMGFETVWLLPEECEQALRVFAHRRLSHGIGLLDSLIGQTAVALGVPLYTFNRKHYVAIPELVTIEPYQKG
ncbi:MAG: type II toxin-antitoxin system VapC family toxin [Chloroflexi bacterium]|nr:type II toxin-antitoxin system VapC family toxin [Chloroflexota bacterium]